MTILGISCHYHEASAALIQDGKIIAAAEEERFTRIKHDANFPKNAIDYCLTYAKKIDYVAFYEKPFQKFERNLTVSLQYVPFSRSWFVESMRNSLTEKLWIKSEIMNRVGVPAERILFVPQHLSHAAASFYPSPFAHAAFLTLDAVGEWTTGSWGLARDNKLFPKFEMRFPHSVGMLYSAVTAFLGFEVNDGEYKVMGMAGYGKPRYTDRIKKLYRQSADGSIELNLDYFEFHRSATRMYSEKFIRLFGQCDKFDLAASIQRVTEDIIFAMMTYIVKSTGETNLVYGGGVALNSVVNGQIVKKTPFKHVFIFPAAGDDGAAVGAALYVHHHVLEKKKRYPLKDMFLGGSFQIDKKFQKNRMTDAKLIDYISDQLIAGKVVGWFEGRAEFGPRALGHRSIFADPKNPKMKDIVNEKVKFREEFRPFAPVILSQYAKKYFDITESNLTPYMLGTFKAKMKKIAPATTHIDGTSRIQTVTGGRLRKLLAVFYKKTGRPILLNTSFNLKGEPIVNSPEDAYSTFMRSGIDVLVLENFVILK